jgi:hypothetical protein
MEIYDYLRDLVLSLDKDVMKFYNKNNKAAGIRVRKKLQEIRTTALHLRLDISETRKNF